MSTAAIPEQFYGFHCNEIETGHLAEPRERRIERNRRFQSERFYREDWSCAVAHDGRFRDSLSLKQYLAASHIVAPLTVKTIPDKQLSAVGAKRYSCIRVPYFDVGLQCLPGHLCAEWS